MIIINTNDHLSINKKAVVIINPELQKPTKLIASQLNCIMQKQILKLTKNKIIIIKMINLQIAELKLLEKEMAISLDNTSGSTHTLNNIDTSNTLNNIDTLDNTSIISKQQALITAKKKVEQESQEAQEASDKAKKAKLVATKAEQELKKAKQEVDQAYKAQIIAEKALEDVKYTNQVINHTKAHKDEKIIVGSVNQLNQLHKKKLSQKIIKPIENNNLEDNLTDKEKLLALLINIKDLEKECERLKTANHIIDKDLHNFYGKLMTTNTEIRKILEQQVIIVY